jgi:hypothetical protein
MIILKNHINEKEKGMAESLNKLIFHNIYGNYKRVRGEMR